MGARHSFSLSLYRFYFLKHEYVAAIVVSGSKSGNLRPAEKKAWSVYDEAKLKGKGKRGERGWMREGCVRKLQWKESDENNDEKNTSVLRDAKHVRCVRKSNQNNHEQSRGSASCSSTATGNFRNFWEIPLMKFPKVTISCGVNVNGSRVPSENKQTNLFTVARYCILSMRWREFHVV